MNDKIDGVNIKSLKVIPDERVWLMEILRCDDEIYQQFGKPTYTVDLVSKTVEIVGLAPGIYHATNEGVCSWYEFAGAVIDNVVPCSSEDFVKKAKRPGYSVLANTKTASMRHWREALLEYLKHEKAGH